MLIRITIDIDVLGFRVTVVQDYMQTYKAGVDANFHHEAVVRVLFRLDQHINPGIHRCSHIYAGVVHEVSFGKKVLGENLGKKLLFGKEEEKKIVSNMWMHAASQPETQRTFIYQPLIGK